jgi:gamma-glutamyl:cysteine ligase YbdK (ATP-grasp superfamily)
MGEDISTVAFSRDDRTRYRRKVRRCLDVFALMLRDFQFDADLPLTGMELELNLIDAAADPAMRNAQVLTALADPAFQTELGLWNIELNARPRMIAGNGFEEYEADLWSAVGRVDEAARKFDAVVAVVGILPTITLRHTVLANLSSNPRYRLLNDQMMAARGGDMAIDIRGPERLQLEIDSIAPEAACTSAQFHLQVSPESFADYWNASQAMAGLQLALGANSPYVYGRQLWAETRIALFGQATDTRPDEFKAQGVRPRVWFGERWITSIFDLFEENLRYFPALLPICDGEDPVEVLSGGGVPRLAELRLHNGTVYRWNRPVYDIMDGRPHLRVENRVLPAGPTVVDLLANGAFYFGLMRALAEADRPIWTSLTFSQAESNFYLCARDGVEARIYWPRLGELAATELVLEHLLPLAHQGLDRFAVAPAARDRLLGVIEGRCRARTNGASWQVEMVRRLEAAGTSRPSALREMLHRYVDRSLSNQPVHTWSYD